MNQCSVCGRTAGSSSSFCLCARCRAQIASLAPDSLRYLWYMKAVKRALQSVSACKKPAFPAD